MKYKLVQTNIDEFSIFDNYGYSGSDNLYGSLIRKFYSKENALEWLANNQKGEDCECWGKGYTKVKYQNTFFISHCSTCGFHENDEQAYAEACRYDWDIYMQEQNRCAKGFTIVPYALQRGVKKINIIK